MSADLNTGKTPSSSGSALPRGNSHQSQLSQYMAKSTLPNLGTEVSANEYRKRKVALITGQSSSLAVEEILTQVTKGITGQDGSYLTELLLEKGYVVHGLQVLSLATPLPFR